MKNYKKFAFIILVCLFLATSFFVFNQANAHPGRTSSDGCHYCRTNCDYWGVPWNERHCHGGSYTPPVSTPAPTPSTKTDYAKLDTTTVSVIEVVDGDTIKIKFSDNTTNKVRLIGIDTPEIVDPRKPVQCFGKEASAYLKSLINGNTVVLTTDKIGDKIDKYDRLLRYVTLNNENINLKMIKDGYAYAYLNYPFDSGKMKAYKEAENYARENNKGLWSPNTCSGGTEIKSTTTPATIQTTTQDTIQPKNEVKNNKPKSNIFVSIGNTIKNFFKKLFK
jgi:micrococcal nuclease